VAWGIRSTLRSVIVKPAARNEDISRTQANIVLLPDVAKFTSTEYDKSVMLIAAATARQKPSDLL
jgi:hypothetical protein